MDITRLRTCTFKSKADFYYNSNWTVKKLFDEKPTEILKAYYTIEKLNFSKEVLEDLKMKFDNFFEIEKPGKKLDWKIIIFPKNTTRWQDKSYNELLTSISWYRIKGKKIPIELHNCFLIAKANYKKIKDNENITISKRSLMYKNHGH